jgi:hypothetical protein
LLYQKPGERGGKEERREFAEKNKIAVNAGTSGR